MEQTVTAEAFQRCLTITLGHEGGWANDPQDPGGATMRGVTQGTYNAYRTRKGLPHHTVRDISQAELQEIYRRQYWDAIRGDDLPAGVDLAVFDFAVNSGTARAVQYLQQAIGARQDRHLGEATLAAITAKGAAETVTALCDARMAFLRRLGTFRRFGAGWTRRVQDIRSNGLHMAAGRRQPLPPAPPHPDVVETPPAAVPAARTTPQTTEGATAIGVGTVGGISAVTDVAKTVHDQAETWTSILASPPLILGAVLVVLAVVLYLARRKRLAQEVE